MPKKKQTGPGKATTGRPKEYDSDSEEEKKRRRDAVAKYRGQVIVDNFVFRNLFSCHQESPAKSWACMMSGYRKGNIFTCR